MELELKEEEVRRLLRDMDDLSRGGATEHDITQLRKAKHDMEKKIKEQVDMKLFSSCIILQINGNYCQYVLS